MEKQAWGLTALKKPAPRSRPVQDRTHDDEHGDQPPLARGKLRLRPRRIMASTPNNKPVLPTGYTNAPSWRWSSCTSSGPDTTAHAVDDGGPLAVGQGRAPVPKAAPLPSLGVAELPLREQQASQTRSRVAHAALELFARQGYAETTIDQIAAAAGASVVVRSFSISQPKTPCCSITSSLNVTC